jgi:hypothetical protein
MGLACRAASTCRGTMGLTFWKAIFMRNEAEAAAKPALSAMDCQAAYIICPAAGRQSCCG